MTADDGGGTSLESESDRLAAETQRLANRFAEKVFPEVSRALHAAVPATVRDWRSKSLEAMPYLDSLPIAGFENTVTSTLHLLANAMGSDDPVHLVRLIEESPAHGLLRFLQHLGPETLLAEERILRSAVVIGLRKELGRVPTAEEAAALHDLLDQMGERSLMALINKRGEERDRTVQSRVSGMHRLADLGTLVAGVAHDAANLFLPLRMRLNHLMQADLPGAIMEELVSIELIVNQFQNSIVNLRWLSVDSSQNHSLPPRSHPKVSLRLREWSEEIVAFHRRMLPPNIRLEIDIGGEVPPVATTSAALSQAVFNLIHNASQAISSKGVGVEGRIVIEARHHGVDTVRITVKDDGPGMPAEVLRRCAEPFFTTRPNGSGLGLALVRALIESCGGTLEIQSPPPGTSHGTIVELMLPIADAT